MRQSLHYQQLRDRFPVLDGRSELVDELLDLYTPRNLYALQTIANKIDAEFREPSLAAIFRLALAACLLPGSRLNGYPGRVASLRITGGHVRQPASRHQREVNVWRLFEASVHDVRTAIAALGRDRRPARFAADLDELGGVGAANVLWIRCRPAVVGQYLPPDGVDLVLGSPPPAGSVDEMSFEYLATAWLLGREAAETLRLEPLFGAAQGQGEPAEGTAMRHAMASAAGALKLVQQHRHQPRAGCAERVADRDRAAVDIDARQIRAGRALPGQHHASEGLVDLDQVDLVERQSGAIKRALRGRDRRGQHQDRIIAGQRERGEARARAQPQPLGGGALHDQQRGRAIADLRGVAGGDHTVGLKGRLQAG